MRGPGFARSECERVSRTAAVAAAHARSHDDDGLMVREARFRPTRCGCGRPGVHAGRCAYRRTLATGQKYIRATTAAHMERIVAPESDADACVRLLGELRDRWPSVWRGVLQFDRALEMMGGVK